MQRVRAMKLMVNNEFTESRLCQFEWATELEASEGVIAISRLKLVDEAKSIAESIQKILNEESHLELIKGIPILTMSDRYRKDRDDILEYFLSPKSMLQHTAPYVAHKRRLEKAQKLHQNLAKEFRATFAAQFTAHDQIGGGKKLVMVRDEEEYDRVEFEIDSQGLANPDFLIIPALPDNLELLSKAIREGNRVLLYLKRDK
ncbi:uncharacterized protein LOC104892605 isoform X2 [Beta vulgaris subsp. vulgaris]|nr:uncharacterized protein LOC104892605 isoform X2 [Beta vulgaris subsp. vulgaris]XP_019105018.1 uncharacterized protein LOC104892605 isoform X2 [Beta vulgaris subsp. vulgaris]